MSPGWSQSQQNLIVTVFAKYFPGAELIFFGSRCTGNFQPGSDLDICIRNAAPLSLSAWSQIEEELSNSDLPFKVDLSDWNRITSEFQNSILARPHILIKLN